MDQNYNLVKLAMIITDKKKLMTWLQELQLIPKEKYCRKHKKNMVFCYEPDRVFGRFACKTKNQCHKVSLTENTWFENSHLSPGVVMLITYCFSWRFSYKQTIQECSLIDDQKLSPESISDRFSYCRELCMIALDESFSNEGKIGGPGVVIEIDECKIGKRKYERGRVVEESWILGMIVRGEPDKYRLEICPDNKRDQSTLLNLIKKHVEIGSEIHTDLWKGYSNLKDNMISYTIQLITRKFC